MKKIYLIVRPAITVLLLMIYSLYQVNAQITTIKNWTSVYHGPSTSQQNVDYAVPAGTNTNRLLLVAIASERTGPGTLIANVTYGGQTLTPAQDDLGTSSIQHTALFYLDEADLDAATGTTLSFSVSLGTSGTAIRNTDVWAAVFDYVSQTAPVTDSRNFNSASNNVTNFAFDPALAVNAYNQAIEVIATFNSGQNKPRTITCAPEWTKILEQSHSYVSGFTSYSMNNAIAGRNYPLTDITDASVTTLDNIAFASMTGISLGFNPPPPPEIQASAPALP